MRTLKLYIIMLAFLNLLILQTHTHARAYSLYKISKNDPKYLLRKSHAHARELV
jgi:hypothetical protein